VEYALSRCFPNPFNADTQIAFQLPQASKVTLTIYSLLGQEVRVLVDGPREAGYYQVSWDGRDGAGQQASSGLYLYRLIVGGDRFSAVRKMVLLK
jgi:flagellar hook assembly protein FlgD